MYIHVYLYILYHIYIYIYTYICVCLYIMKATPVPERHVMSLCHLKCSQAGRWPRSPSLSRAWQSTVVGGQADWSSWHWNPLRFFWWAQTCDMCTLSCRNSGYIPRSCVFGLAQTPARSCSGVRSSTWPRLWMTVQSPGMSGRSVQRWLT